MDALSFNLCFDTTSMAHRDAVRGERHPPHLCIRPAPTAASISDRKDLYFGSVSMVGHSAGFKLKSSAQKDGPRHRLTHDHLTSDDAVEDAIIANEYMFTEAGLRFRH